MGLHDPFGHFKHKLWPKERSGVTLISLRVNDVPHTIRKLLMRVASLLHTSSQSEVCTQSYVPQSCGNPSCENFETPT
jgi:hypothetical protein